MWFAYVKNAKFFHIIIATTSNGVVESSWFPQELGLQLDSNCNFQTHCRETIPEKSNKSVFLPIFCWKTDAWKVLFEFYSSSDSHRSWTTPEGLKQLTLESYSISTCHVEFEWSRRDVASPMPSRTLPFPGNPPRSPGDCLGSQNDELLHLFLKQTKHTEEQTHRGK